VPAQAAAPFKVEPAPTMQEEAPCKVEPAPMLVQNEVKPEENAAPGESDGTGCTDNHASPAPARSSSSLKEALPRPALIPADADGRVGHIHGISFPPGAELVGCGCDLENDNAMMPRTVELMAGNKSMAEMQLLKVDVTTHEGHKLVEYLCKSYIIEVFCCTPPYSTASRARDGKIPDPVPLGSAQHPLGIPSCSICKHPLQFTAKLAWMCLELQIALLVKNPAKTYIWLIPFMMQLANDSRAKVCEYDACMLGGTRKIAQKLLYAFVDLPSMALKCDDDHSHEPWTFSQDSGFSTAHEAEYPLVLCQRIARLVKQHHGKIKLKKSAEPKPLRSGPKRRALAAAACGRQPRGHRFPKVISEYKCTKTVILTEHPHLHGKTAFQKAWRGAPEGSKLLTKSIGDVPKQFDMQEFVDKESLRPPDLP
jgi:hypothetical protein